ncbi:MAG: hypothetical protein D6696_13590, partial [Acidobacteria bacterium]
MLASAALAALGLLAVAAVAAAQPDNDLAALLAELEPGFEVLPLTDGYVLKPRAEDAPVQLLEVRDGAVIADGEPLTRRRLRRLLGDSAAAALLELAELTAAADELASARRRLA